MSNLPIKNINGKSQGTCDIPDDLLVYDKGEQAVNEAVKAYLANQRQGSAFTLDIGEVSGTNRKQWKQKGTGRARAGRRQSPIWRGGGVAFGPKPRNYRKTLTKKTLKLALRRAFSEVVAAGNITVLDELSLEEPKTKDFQAILKALELERGVLFIVNAMDKTLILASRNIPLVEITTSQNLNVYQLMRYAHVVITKEALNALTLRIQSAKESAA